MQERLQKIISQAGIASRRDAEEIIKAGRVKVNGQVITEMGLKFDSERDKIIVDGKLIRAEKHVYILMNKPKGVVTSLNDPEGRKTVADLLHDVKERVYPVGRLDYNTEGLLLLTNDGELTHALTHPSNEIGKIYRAKVIGLPTDEKIDLLRTGIKLEDGVTAPAIVRVMEYDRNKNITDVEISIHEGRNRQVRRMFDAIGHPVRNLKRVQMAFLVLEGLGRGRYRHLEAHEVARLKALKK